MAAEQWQNIKDFIDERTRLCVRVTELDRGHFRNWNVIVGILPPDPPEGQPKEEYPRLRMFIPIRFEKESLKLQSSGIALEHDYVTTLLTLWSRAVSFVHDKANLEHAERQNDAYERDRKRAERGKPHQPKTGKTEREREKRKAG